MSNNTNMKVLEKNLLLKNNFFPTLPADCFEDFINTCSELLVQFLQKIYSPEI